MHHVRLRRSSDGDQREFRIGPMMNDEEFAKLAAWRDACGPSGLSVVQYADDDEMPPTIPED